VATLAFGWLVLGTTGRAVATPVNAPATGGNTTTAALVAANNRFALDLLHEMNPSARDNVFFSPYSISTALAMTWAGAKGETAAQMAQVLHLADLPAAEVGPGFGMLQQMLAQMQNQDKLLATVNNASWRQELARRQTEQGLKLSVVNSLWPNVNPEYPFLARYLRQVETDFDSAVYPVDYQNQAAAARLKVNAWVAEKTQDKIKDILGPEDVTPATRLLLVNAIYFKGAWTSPFDSKDTEDAPYYLSDGSKQNVAMMEQYGKAGYANITDGPVPCQVLELPYWSLREFLPLGDGATLSLVVVLPRKPGDLGALEKALTVEQLAGWMHTRAWKTVHIYLPKFKITEKYSMREMLQALGIKNAFIDPGMAQLNPNRADFSGMDGVRGLFISKVIHQAYVEVDEKGTEAAATTVVEMGMTGIMKNPPPPPVFRADHPFLFLIRENATGSILFMGQFAAPEASKPAGMEQTAARAPGK